MHALHGSEGTGGSKRRQRQRRGRVLLGPKAVRVTYQVIQQHAPSAAFIEGFGHLVEQRVHIELHVKLLDSDGADVLFQSVCNVELL